MHSEGYKVFSLLYGGSPEVTQAFGASEVNDAINSLVRRGKHLRWRTARLVISPSSVHLISNGLVITECRTRFISFISVYAKDCRICGFIQQGARGNYVCHIVACEPNAVTVCEAIKSACEVRRYVLK
ncbi:unnamed protein product [Dicrocoelium dendriticum]|nr:unnamed protein product [Dicrocoelium dendriticum]